VWESLKLGFRFVAGNARLPVAHGFRRLRCVEGSRTCVRSYPAGRPHVGCATTYPTRGVGAHDVGEKPTKRRCHTPYVYECSPTNQPQCQEEPAGSPLGAGSRRRGIRTDQARRGPARTAGRSRETGCRVENPCAKPDPARRAIDKRPRSGLSLAGRRRRGTEGATRRLLLQDAKAQGPTRCRRRATRPQKKAGRRRPAFLMQLGYPKA